MRTFKTMEEALEYARDEDKVVTVRVENESWKYWKVFPWGQKHATAAPREEKK